MHPSSSNNLSIYQCSGDADGRVPVIGSRYCVEALGLPIKTQWQPWYLDKQVWTSSWTEHLVNWPWVVSVSVILKCRPNHAMQVAGRFVEYHGMSMVTVRGAGHLVPLNKPAEGLMLINTFLNGEQLPTRRWYVAKEDLGKKMTLEMGDNVRTEQW